MWHNKCFKLIFIRILNSKKLLNFFWHDDLKKIANEITDIYKSKNIKKIFFEGRRVGLSPEASPLGTSIV